ncbi:hypothetical protein BC830DRAFT_132099 [Chytriomyces sp. MP71]|nr:hypothetical protein BC830DRAFT_132099 [Chytriomyces sp. MP71]
MVNFQSQHQLSFGSSGGPSSNTGYGLGLGQPCSSDGCHSGLTCVAPPNAPSAGICQYDGLGNNCCVSGTDPDTPPCPGASVCAPATPSSDTGHCVSPFEGQFCFVRTYYACQMGLKCVATGTIGFAGTPGLCQVAQAGCLGDTCPVGDADACEVGLQCVGSSETESFWGTCLVPPVMGLSQTSRASNHLQFSAVATVPPTSGDSGPSTGATTTGFQTSRAIPSITADFSSTNAYLQTVTSTESKSVDFRITANNSTNVNATRLNDGALIASYARSSVRSDASISVAIDAALCATVSFLFLV